MSTADLPEFWSFQGRLFAMDIVGKAESWAAPVAKLFAPHGLAVQAWIDEMPDSGTAWDRADFESWLAIFKASVERAYKI